MGWTALHHAARAGSVDLCKLLVVNRCKIDTKNKVIKATRDVSENNPSIFLPYLSFFILSLSHPVSPTPSLPSFPQQGLTPLHYAAREGFLDVLILLYDYVRPRSTASANVEVGNNQYKQQPYYSNQ